jgi:tetratricopeptide (TPR) repeat protein
MEMTLKRGFAALFVTVLAAAAAPVRTDPAVPAAAGLMRHEDYRAASQLLEAALAAHPGGAPDLYAMLAVCRLKMNQPEEALRVSERALETHPGSPRLEKSYVEVLWAACAKPDRKARLTAALRRAPASPFFMMALAEILLAEDAVEYQFQIEPLVRKAALARPLDPQAHYLLGQWACLNDRQDLSVRELTRALELTSANPRARMQIHTYLGISYERLNRPGDAEKAYRQALAVNRKLRAPDPGAYMQLAKFLEDEQREAEAQEVLAEVLRLAPAFGPAHLERAKFLADQDKPVEALAEGELALRYAGTGGLQLRAAHAFLARIDSVLGRAGEAKAHREWIETHPQP